MLNLTDSIIRRIRAKGRGLVYTPKDFLDLGNRAAVDKALSRLARRGHIRRLSRGVYDYPKINPKLGALTPSPDALAKLIAKKTNSKLQVTGAQAANELGLSTQVPARLVYFTDGHPKRFRIGNQIIEFRHASPSSMATAGKPVGTIIQALRYIGRDNINADTIKRLKKSLSANDKAALKKDIDNAPDWLRPIITEIVS